MGTTADAGARASFLHLYAERVAASGDAPYLAYYDGGGARAAWTYAEFDREVRRAVARLRGLGIGAGSRVAIVSHNRPEVYVGYFACWVMGAVACPINVDERPERKRYILNNAGCAVAWVEPEFADEMRLAQAAAPALRHILVMGDGPIGPAEAPWATLTALDPDAPAFQVYTSGTTGDPKGVLLRHANLIANARATADWHDLRPGDGVMTVLPIHHVNGAIVTGLTSFVAGARNVLNRRFSPAAFWRRLADERCALTSVVPTLLQFLLSADEDLASYDLSALRYVLCGAGPLLSETALRFEDRFGVPICHGFGMSETTAYNTQMPMGLADDERRGWYSRHGYPSIGCAIACNDVAILRPDGSPCAPLERGEICIRGPAVMDGYVNSPEANARAFTHGWFHSGDQGFFDLDAGGRAFFFISGRLKELIIRGGVNYSPLDIDQVLNRIDGVRFALAVPFENVFYGEEVAAYVVPQPGARLTERDVLDAARAALPFAQCPKVVIFGEGVPFTATGKARRIELARMLADRLRPYREVQFRA